MNWFDRSATSHYSETAANVSDILYGAAVAAPFVLFANETMRNDWRTITLIVYGNMVIYRRDIDAKQRVHREIPSVCI